jgi:hypothetical protein
MPRWAKSSCITFRSWPVLSAASLRPRPQVKESYALVDQPCSRWHSIPDRSVGGIYAARDTPLCDVLVASEKENRQYDQSTTGTYPEKIGEDATNWPPSLSPRAIFIGGIGFPLPRLDCNKAVKKRIERS